MNVFLFRLLIKQNTPQQLKYRNLYLKLEMTFISIKPILLGLHLRFERNLYTAD